MNTWKRKSLAVAAVALLSVPSAIGVQHALEPTRGAIASWLAAAGFEAVYISTAILILSDELRRYAQRVAVAAVAVAVLLNTIADYGTRVPGGLDNGAAFVATFDWLSLLLSVVESLPLAALAYAMATLLHRLSGPELELLHPNHKGQNENVYRGLTCDYCGADGLTMTEKAAHHRRHQAERRRAAANGHQSGEIPSVSGETE